MNLAFLNKIIDAIFKIASKGKIVNEMPENDTTQAQPQNTTVLTPNTPIQFTLKGFILTILTILGMFIGFYKLAIQPAIASSELHYQNALKNQKEHIDEKFDNLEEKVDRNGTLIEKNHNRFRDLSKETPNNSSGSLGNTGVSGLRIDPDSTTEFNPN